MRTYLTAAALLVLLAGCGGGGDEPQVATAGDGGTTTSAAPDGDQPAADDEERMRQFAACMREHGVDAPDPDPDGGGRVLVPRGDGAPQVDDGKLREALEACRHLGPERGTRLGGSGGGG